MTMQAIVQLSLEAREALSRSTITSYSVALPEKIDRRLYIQLNRLFETVGGKWNRWRQAHLFPRDPREVLGLAVEKREALETLTPDELTIDGERVR